MIAASNPYRAIGCKVTADAFSGLRQRLIDQAKPALDLEQKAWTVFRDSDCDTAFNKPFKGPQKRPKRLCLTRHFEARLLTLEGRLKTLGSSRVSKSANLRKATKLLPFGSYHLTAQHGTKSQVTANLTFDSDRIVLGDKLCLSPSIQPYGVENYFFFKNNFGIKDPGLFGWSNRSGARSLALEVRCGAGDLGYACVFLVGKPGTLGLMIDKSTFLTFKKQ